MHTEAKEMLDRVHRTYQQVQVVKADDKIVDANRLTELADNWKDEQIPLLQRQVIDVELENLRHGVVDPVYLTFLKALRAVKLKTFSFLDVGCASGHYGEVIKRLDRREISYQGCDYSAAMIQCAKQYYPDVEFAVQDVMSLSYPDQAFDVVMVSGVLQYVADYHAAIANVLRVARQYALFHRLPVTGGKENQYHENAQYSILTVKTLFAKKKILQEIRRHGFALVQDLRVYAPDSLGGEVKRIVKEILRGSGRTCRAETLLFQRRPESSRC